MGKKKDNKKPKEILPEVPEHLRPLTVEDLRDYSAATGTDPSTLQLQVDVINVAEGRVPISNFPQDYQQKIENYYRFSGATPGTIQGMIAQASVGRMGKG